MTPDEVSKQIDEIISEAVEKFGKRIDSTNEALFSELQKLFNKLELNDDGTINQSQYNRKQLLKVEQHINQALRSSGYYVSLNDFVGNIPQVSDVATTYFQSHFESFSGGSQFTKSLQRQAISEIEIYMANEGLEAILKNPILNVLNQNINTGASISDLTKQIREFILGSDELDPTLSRYAKTITKDALFNYSAAYQEAVSQNLGMEFYKYSGSSRKASRSFCVSRANQYYHKTEVEEWAALSWAGKRKGTTRSTIFIYRGGWNCEHQLIAVPTSIVPSDAIERAKEKGLLKAA